MIKPYGGSCWPNHYADHSDIRQYLGFKRHEKLPTGYSNVTRVPLTDNRTTTLIVHKGTQSLNGWRGKQAKHRCFAICPDCSAMVPAGRSHQHKCK